MTSIHIIVNVQKNNNAVNKIKTLSYINLEFILQYITLTSYYIVKDTLRPR